jgi:hypothetical protein
MTQKHITNLKRLHTRVLRWAIRAPILCTAAAAPEGWAARFLALLRRCGLTGAELALETDLSQASQHLDPAVWVQLATHGAPSAWQAFFP